MRLRIMFFPIMLILPISLFFGFVYPEIKSATDIYARNKDLKEKISKINEKKSNIQNLDQMLGKNKNEEYYISEYLPLKRSEERAIDAVNTLAEGALLVLTNITISNDSMAKISEKEEYVPTNYFNPSVASAPAQQQVPINQTAEKNINLKKTSLKISVIGKYENIKSFISTLRSLDMMNEAVSIEIKKAEENTGNGSQGEEQVAVQPSESLLAEISVDFYYTGKIRSLDYLNESMFDSSTLDFSNVKAVGDFASKEMQDLQLVGKSKINPFL